MCWGEGVLLGVKGSAVRKGEERIVRPSVVRQMVISVYESVPDLFLNIWLRMWQLNDEGLGKDVNVVKSQIFKLLTSVGWQGIFFCTENMWNALTLLGGS